MLYYFVKITLLLFQRVYFKRIYISGAENIPQDRPVFLASNHSNGFLDGVMVSALLIPKPTRIFVRGDVFKKGWANLILRSLKLIPIFRARDGESRDNLVANNQSFDQLYEEFKKNRVVLIFPEADAQIEKRLRPLKKGMARIITDMQSRGDGSMKVAIVPFGLNYTHYKKHRNEMMLSFGKPVYLSDYQLEGVNERAALNKLTSDVGEKIKEHMVNIAPGDDDVTESALRIFRANRKEPILKFWFTKRDRLAGEIEITEKIKASEADSELRKAIANYQDALDLAGVSEEGSKSLKLWQWLFMAVFILPSSLSWLVMRWGFVYGKKVVDAKVKKDELYESVYFGISIFWNWLLVLIGYPVAAILFGWKGVAIWFAFRWLSIPFQHCMDFWKQYVNHKKWVKNQKELDTKRQVVSDLLNL